MSSVLDNNIAVCIYVWVVRETEFSESPRAVSCSLHICVACEKKETNKILLAILNQQKQTITAIKNKNSPEKDC
jgi:hypothetical protein